MWYENLRSITLLAFDHRVRPPVRPGERHGRQRRHYPPYNIERTSEDQYRISLVLVGFTPDDVAITAERSTLTVEGRKTDEDERDYLYQGISVRPFRRLFNLADYVQVKNATFEHGLLRITLAWEVPESLKPRQIAIDVAGNDHQKSDRTQAA
jgi:molecular chaperone IbpA